MGAWCADLPVRCFCKQLGGNTVDLRPQGSRLPEKKKRREARLDYVEDTLESQGQGIKTLEKIFLRQEDRRTKRMGREERLSEPTARTRRRREESPRETHEEKAPLTERPRGSRCAAPEQEAQASIWELMPEF